ncbi:phosphoribosyltransferase [Vibrio astriarenae]|nr:phosphoribosyltransferase [Vibrio sp. C7]
MTYAVIYSSPELEQSCIDFYIKEVPRPRVFEWNLFHHSILSSSCVDIDGVLCEDIDRRDDDDGERYVDLIMQVKPKFIPTKTIDTLVTNRLEKYRDITEAWLKKHNINYNSLVMNPCATAEERREKNNYISHKSNAFKKSGNLLFIESDIKQAAGIAKETGYSVICTDTNEILHPNYYSRVSSVSGIKANIKMRLLKSKLFMRIYRKICR